MGLTEVLAVYGASLSTVVAVWNAARARPKIRVRLNYSIRTEGGKTEVGLGVSVQNPSAHPVHITNIAFLYPYTNPTLLDRVKHAIEFRKIPIRIGWCHSAFEFNGVDDGCPISIEPGKSHWVFVPQAVFHRILRDAVRARLRVVVQDALWRNKVSNTFVYDLPGRIQQDETAEVES